MFKKSNNSGWILCPSKSYPGKFYYFNVLNGEAAWSLNENEKKVFKKEVAIQKVKANHLYPEPITPPDHPSPRSYNDHSAIRTCLPTFGQAVFPNYISNNKQDLSNICSPIQMLQNVTNTNIMFSQSTQTEQDNVNIHTHTIPLSKRFENNKNENFVLNNYISARQPKDWWNSTNIWSNIGKHSNTADMYRQKLIPKSLLKESKLKKKHVFHKHVEQNSIQLQCNKVENSKATNKILINMDVNDLRHVIRAKRRKCVDIQNLYSKVNKEHSTLNVTNKETFNIRHNNEYHLEEKYIGKETTYIDNENQQLSEWYLVVDLDVLLEDYDFINRYIDKDENCHIYVPSVIINQLKNICMGEHGGRSRVMFARQLLRKLETVMPKLNLLENKEDTKMNQIINCCLEIIKGNNDVVLITKETKVIQTAKLYKIKAYHINDLKSNDIENFNHTYKHKNNLFLQNTDDFDPFSLSKTVRLTENRPNISDTSKSFNNDLVVHISDINLNFSKLNINDKILNIKRKVENNLYEKNNIKTNDNCNYKTLFHNINNNKSNQGLSNDINNNRLFNKKQSTNITFSANKQNLKNYLDNNTNVNFIRKPLNDEDFYSNAAPNNIFEDMLKKFHITNSVMEHNLYVKFDEWVCSYEQIMEDFLHIILQKNPQVNQPSPWFLHEGMECLKNIYRDNEYIVNIIEKLLYYYDYSESGTNTKPYNFMKLFGCGFYLVEALEKISPFLISDIKKKLIYLRNDLECPIKDLFLDSPICNNTEDEQTNRCNFVKNPSDILDYLKKHFSEWKNYNGAYDNINLVEQEVHKNNTKVLRTFGRHLNKLTINKSKCISYIKETDKQTHKHDLQSNDYPKVIRNIKLLDTYEEKIKRNEIGLDYPEIAETISSINLDENKAIINGIAETNDFGIVSQNNDSQNNNLSINDNDSTKDSGFGSNSLLAYSLVRIFLSELSSSFKIIHTFIDESIKDYSDDITEENKKNLYEKAIKTHTHVADIIDKLKIIIQRESIENSTLKSLLIKAGTDDKRTTRYRPVVMKCLEQATILEKSLKLMLSITNDEVLSVSSEEHVHFINIYE